MTSRISSGRVGAVRAGAGAGAETIEWSAAWLGDATPDLGVIPLLLTLHANLYLAVMEMPGFSKEALIVAYTFLLDNKAQGRGFVNMSDAHRTIWLRTFLAKNYYV
jgi:hypothetical protein